MAQTEPWEWSDKKCINDGVGLPNDEGRPYFCLGSGSNPSSRACLSNCNFMLNTINSVNPCNANLYAAGKSCASCVPGGAIHYQLDGKSPSGPYISGEGSMNTFLDGLKDWCAKPSRCLDLTTGSKISALNGCPVIADTNQQSSPAGRGGSTVINNGGGSTTTVRGGGGSGSGSTTVIRGNNGSSSTAVIVDGTTIPAKLVSTKTISTTDAEGRATFSIELATVDNPAFTAQTGFAGARPSSSDSETGAAVKLSDFKSTGALLVLLATLLSLCLIE